MFAVLSMETAPEHLRGYLSRFLSPIHTGLYVGTVTPRVVDELWENLERTLKGGRAALITSSGATEHGFELRLLGHDRTAVRDFDGLPLPILLPGRPDTVRPPEAQ